MTRGLGSSKARHPDRSRGISGLSESPMNLLFGESCSASSLSRLICSLRPVKWHFSRLMRRSPQRFPFFFPLHVHPDKRKRGHYYYVSLRLLVLPGRWWAIVTQSGGYWDWARVVAWVAFLTFLSNGTRSGHNNFDGHTKEFSRCFLHPENKPLFLQLPESYVTVKEEGNPRNFFRLKFI